MKTLGSCRRQRGGVLEFEGSLQSNLTHPIIATEEMDAQGGAYVMPSDYIDSSCCLS